MNTIFLQKMKANAEAMASKMAKVELSVWNDDHIKSMQDFGYSEKEINARKNNLIKLSK